MEIARKLWTILTRAQRIDAVTLLGLMLIGMMLEMFGVGLVLPALALMTGAGGITTVDQSTTKLMEMMGNPERGQLVMFGMIALVAVFAIKAVFLAYLASRQMRFVYDARAAISYRLFQIYLDQPYAFHLQRNSAQLIRNVVNETDVLCHAMLTPVLNLLTEGFVLVGVAAVLIVLEPLGAMIVVATLGLLGLAVHLVTRGSVLRWGEARQLHEGLRIQHLQQGLGSVKDVLLLHRQREFLRQYDFHNNGSAAVNRKLQTLHLMPRLGLELLAVISLALLVLVMLKRGIVLEAILPTIGLFAAAAFRIMPSGNRVINSIHSMRYGAPVVSTLHNELCLPSSTAKPVQENAPFANHIRLTNVSYIYSGSDTAALNGINLTIRHGTTVGFIGGSGAGKSTLVDVLLGLLPPDSGRVEVDAVDVAINRYGWQRNIGYVPQTIFLTDDTLRRNIAFGIAEQDIDDRAVVRAMKAAQLEDYIASLPEGLETTVGERGIRLSGGQLQRVGIARALYHDPAVLVLDEATSALDTATERSVMRAVGALHGRKTIIIVAHRLSTLRDCDWIFKLENGRLVAEGDVTKMIGPALLGVSDRAAEEHRAAAQNAQ